MTKDLETSHRERKKQAAELIKSPHLFRMVLEASGVPMSIRNRDFYPIFANQAFWDFYGYTPEAIMNLTPKEALPAETYTLFVKTVLPHLHKGESWEGEYIVRIKNGRLRSVWGRFDPVLNNNGELVHIISVMRDASASQQLRNALLQTERHLHFLADNTSDCLFRIRLSDGRYDYISSAVKNITGHTPQEYYENPDLLEQLTPEDWAQTFKLWWSEFLEGKTRYEYESPLIHRDGTCKWVSRRITLVKDAKDIPIAIEGILTDVTERRKAQDELAVAQKSLNFISESTSDIFFRITLADGTFDYLSPSIERFSGYTLTEYENDPKLAHHIVHSDWRAYTDEIYAEMKRGKIRPEYVFQYVHKSGDIRWARQRVVLHKDENGTPIAIEGIASDITDAKIAEEALRKSEHKYRMLVENITDVVWTLDNHTTITYATPSAANLWGYSVTELVGMDYRELFTPESLDRLTTINRLRQSAEKNGDYETMSRVEFEHRRNDGTTIWAESLVQRTFDSNGIPDGYLLTSRDVTERRHAENALRTSESRFRTLFEDSPISLWEEDLTRLKVYFDELRDSGVTDFHTFFHDNPTALHTCATCVEVVDVNKATLTLLKARNRTDLLCSLDKILTESSMRAFAEEMTLLASGVMEYCGEITHKTLEGDTIWVVVHFKVPTEYQTTLSRVVVSLIDVTARKKAEQALMESEERYRILVENANEGVVVSRGDTTLFINETLGEILEFSHEELMSFKPFDVMHPDDKADVLQQLEQYIQGNREDGFVTARLITKRNHIKWTTIHLRQISWDGKPAELKIIMDITPHKTLERELRLAHAEMENRVRKRTAQLSNEVMERRRAQEHIQTLTQQLIRIQEDERQRIARDLHDNVAQDLSSSVLNLETMFDGYDNTSEEVQQRGKAVTDILRGSIAEVRDIAYGLRPPALDQLGLQQALVNLCEDTALKTRMVIDFTATGIENIELDFDTEINIYRMLQEAINNMAKHAEASRGTVRLVRSHPDLLIRVEDNGTGFDVDKRLNDAIHERRMGLRSMEERARILGGSMDIQSRIGTGTRIAFKIPIT